MVADASNGEKLESGAAPHAPSVSPPGPGDLEVTQLPAARPQPLDTPMSVEGLKKKAAAVSSSLGKQKLKGSRGPRARRRQQEGVQQQDDGSGESDDLQEADATTMEVLDDIGERAAKLTQPFMQGAYNFMHRVAEKRKPEDGRKLPAARELDVPDEFKNVGEFVKYRLARKHRVEAGVEGDEARKMVRVCEEGHVMEECVCKKARTCKWCTRKIQRDEEMHKCPEKACKYYLCADCFHTGPPPEPPVIDYEAEAEKQELFEAGVDELHKAAVQDDGRRIRLLLAGPDPSRHLPHPDIAMADSIITPALKAAKLGNACSCAALLDFHADPTVRDDFPKFFGDAVWPSEKRPDMYGKEKPHDSKDIGALPGRTLIYWLRLKGKLDDVLKEVFPITRVNLVRSIAAAVQDHAGEPALVAAARTGSAELAALLLTHMAPGLPPLVPPPGAASPTAGGWTTRSSGWASSLDTGTNPGSTIGAGTTAATAFGAGSGSSSPSSPWTSPIAVNHEKAAGLLMACSNKEWKTATIIIGAGVSGSHMGLAKDRLGRTSLHTAAAFGAEDVVRMLLKAGHPYKLTSYRGRQPLHEAVASGHTGAAQALLEAKADPCVPTEEDKGDRPILPGRSTSKRGLTALDMAGAKKGGALNDLLLRHSVAAGAASPAGGCRGGGTLGRGLSRVATEPQPLRGRLAA